MCLFVRVCAYMSIRECMRVCVSVCELSRGLAAVVKDGWFGLRILQF